jgi:hypothetical protein
MLQPIQKMIMKTERTFTAGEIRELVEIMRNDPNLSSEKFSGMEFVASAFERFKHMGNDDLQAMVRNYYPRV